jgi:formylglycine-generating enzyme required for sulfatase activity
MLTRLELAGFSLSPAEKIRLLQVISGPASAHWREPQKLRFLLAPVIARSKAEQERFYAIFDQYYTELLDAASDADKADAKNAWLKMLRTWLRRWWWVFPSVLLLAVLSYLIYPLLKSDPGVTTVGYSISSTPIRVGDTATFTLNTKNIDTAGAKIHWSLRDKASDSLEQENFGSKNWRVPFKVLQGNPKKTVTLEIQEKKRDTTFRYQGDLLVECTNPPQLDGLDLPDNLLPGEAYTFSPNVLDDSTDLQFLWDFGDAQTSTLRNPTHSYLEDGSYEVELKVTRLGLPGFCTSSTSATMRVGETQVFLPWYDLQYDPVKPEAAFDWGTWLIVVLLAAASFYCLFRWAKTQRPIANEVPVGQPRGLPRQSPDRPPYEIPFRSLNGLIRNLAGQFRLADALRRRQEGLRQEVDVPKTLDATIAGGGYPSLQFRSTTRPSDYLFLVDEQNESSHQGRLLRHLVKVLHDQDVHAEVFYYRSHFFHFWNEQFPQGVTLEQISRLCPEHRVIVFGDSHGLLDPYAKENQTLRKESAADLQRWKRRLLLTPRPPLSWDYREDSLHRILPVFPADLEGQMAAANFIDNGMEADDLPTTFSSWRQSLATTREEPDINRRWRSASDHAEYLGYGSDLYRWLCALAVYPTPTWEITLAIGAALDIPLNADNLLLLARIPSLQEGKISPRLRKELLADLDLYDEELARQAITKELEDSMAEAAPGFANRALQTNLTVQRFALAPFEPTTQEQVKLLLDKGWFNRVHIEDLGGVAVRELAPMQRSRRMTKGGFAEESAMAEESFQSNTSQQNVGQTNMPNFNRPIFPLQPDEPTLRRFLEEHGEVAQQEIPVTEKPPKPPVFNRAFWQMLACAVAFLTLVFSILMLDNTPRLYRWAFGQEPAARLFEPETKLRGNLLIKEVVNSDSATLLNNQAVQLYQEKAFSEMLAASRASNEGPQTYAYPPQVRKLLEQAQLANPQHLSAALNLARLNYNLGVTYFRAWQNQSYLRAPDSLSLLFFQQNRELETVFSAKNVPAVDQAAYQRLALASLHGEGVILYLTNTVKDPAQAEGIYADLDRRGFFDTTQVRPNLSTLLQKEPSRIVEIIPGQASNQSLELQVKYFKNPNRYETLSLRVLARERNNQPNNASFIRPQEQVAAYLRDGNQTFTLRSNLNRPGDVRRTDSLVAELILINPNSGSRKVLNRLVIPYVKQWGLRPEATTTLSTRVLDDRTGEPISKVTLTYLDNVSNAVLSRGLSDAKGIYAVRRDLSRIKGVKIQVSAEGYQPLSRDYNLAELRRMDNRTTDIRLKPVAERNADPRQTEQTTNGERTDYKPILPDMVQVSGGSFVMGCQDGRDKDCEGPEKPDHEVTLSTYSIGKYEVTNAEYAVFMNDIIENPTRADDPDKYISADKFGLQKTSINGNDHWQPDKGYERYPVVNVTWRGAEAYCNWLSKKTGQRYRLPTEAEWEYAARGGEYSQKDKFQYAGSDNLNEVAWYKGNSKGSAHQVGQKKANQLGIHDLSGNLNEWCQDWFGYYEAKPQTNPSGAATGRGRITRSGSWDSNAVNCRVSDRYLNDPGMDIGAIGFRLAMSGVPASGR